MRIIILLICASALMGACSEKVLDGSSPEALAASMNKFQQQMDPGEYEAFEQAVELIVRDFAAARTQTTDPFLLFPLSDVADTLSGAVNGLSVAEVLEKAALIEERVELELAEIEENLERLAAEQALERAARREADISEIQSELVNLENQLKTVDMEIDQQTVLASRASLIQVTSAAFRYRESRTRREPLVELSLLNNSNTALSRLYFHGVLATPGRSVPWVDEDFNYSIPGGIEPGEPFDVTLAPSMFSEWSQAPHDRQDMILTVSVYKAEDAAGEIFINTRPGNQLQSQKSRLEQRSLALREQLDHLQAQ